MYRTQAKAAVRDERGPRSFGTVRLATAECGAAEQPRPRRAVSGVTGIMSLLMLANRVPRMVTHQHAGHSRELVGWYTGGTP